MRIFSKLQHPSFPQLPSVLPWGKMIEQPVIIRRQQSTVSFFSPNIRQGIPQHNTDIFMFFHSWIYDKVCYYCVLNSSLPAAWISRLLIYFDICSLCQRYRSILQASMTLKSSLNVNACIYFSVWNKHCRPVLFLSHVV